MSEKTWYAFDGDDDCEDCKGWDGIENKCDCGNRGVSWECLKSKCECTSEQMESCEHAYASAN